MKKWPELIKGVLPRQVRLFGFDVRTQTDVQAEVDHIIGGLKMIDALHAKTHEGVAYELTVLASNVAAGQALNVLLQCDWKHSVHLRPAFASEGPCRGFIFEGPEYSAAGSPLTPMNRNRKVWAPAAKAVLTSGPTLTGDGTQLTVAPIFSASGPGHTSTGGTHGTFEEWLLNNNEDYLFRIVNDDAGAKDLWLSLTFYEERVDV